MALNAPAMRSWLEPHLEAVLRSRKHILANWRRQVPAQKGETKSFENWLLVELTNHILGAGIARELRTNGHFGKQKVRARDVRNLRGSKAKAKHLSADLVIETASKGLIVAAEIKCGFNRQEILNDLHIVRRYNSLKIPYQAEFGWAVLLPQPEKACRSCVKTFEKTYQLLRQQNPDFHIRRKNVTDWLGFCVAVPVKRSTRTS